MVVGMGIKVDALNVWLGCGFKYFLMLIPILGEDSYFDEHIFQMGWNHQLDGKFEGFAWVLGISWPLDPF